MIIKEFCAENTTLLNQLNQSVKRVELCDNLAVGVQRHLMVLSKKRHATCMKKTSH